MDLVSEGAPQPQRRVVSPLTPVVPDEEVRAELEAMLRSEPTRLGEVFLRIEQGHNAEEMQTEFGLQHPNFFWNYQRTIRAIVDGDLPTAPTVALAVARKFRKLLRTQRLSDEARAVLAANLAVLEARADDETSREAETVEALQATAEAEAQAPTGIYVYTLPHYLRHPYDEDTGRTLLKVGRSDRDVIERFRNQTRTTALPEEPVLLRIYLAPEDRSPVELERRFHRLLEAADHDRSRARTGGTEWFLTSVKFLDEVALTLEMPIQHVVDAPEADD